VGCVHGRPALTKGIHQPQNPPKVERSSEWTAERKLESAAWRAQCEQASLRWQHELRKRSEFDSQRLTELAVQRQKEKMEAHATRKSEDGETFYQSRRWQNCDMRRFCVMVVLVHCV